MKTPRLLLASLTFVVTLSSLSVFSYGAADTDLTELGARMEDINTSWRRLRRQVADPTKNAASLELLAAIRVASKGTERMAPEMASDIPEAKRAKFQEDYAAAMKKFFAQIDALEAAFKAGDNEKAGKVVAEISDFQRAAHKDFRKDTGK